MRKRLVDSYTDPATSIKYGLRGDPEDFALAQAYTHDHVSQLTRDFLSEGFAAAVVAGFDYTLAGGLSLSIAAGRAYDAAGVFFETITSPAGQPAAVALEAADVANARVDLVYALLEPAVQAEAVPRTFRRLLSDAEITAGQPPYLPTNITRFSEEHARASVRVRKGTPAAVPVAPALQANETPLFEVRVNAGAVTLVAGNVTDRRIMSRSLGDAWVQIDALNQNPAIASFNETVQDLVATMIADSTSLTHSYNDAAGTLTLDVDTAWLNEQVDDRVAALVLDGTYLTKAYNDAAGTLTLDVDVAALGPALAEHIDDRVAALIVDSTYLTKVYDDIGNLLTFDVDIAAVGPALDSRFVNTAGDNMTGVLTVKPQGDAAALNGAAYAGTLGLEVHAINLTLGTESRAIVARANGGAATAVYGRATSGTNGDASYGGRFETGINVGSNPVGQTHYGVAGKAEGSGTNYAVYGTAPTTANQYAGYFNGNAHVTGAISAGSKPFVIDHPRPDLSREKLLRYMATETHRADVYARGVARLTAGRVEVNLDELARQSPGTMLALAREFQPLAWNLSGPGSAGEWEPVRARLDGAKLVIYARDPEASFEVGFIVWAERQDAYIRHAGLTDDEGRLIVEFDKDDVTAEEVAVATTPVIFAVESEETAPDEEREVEADGLRGRRGFYLHPAAFGEESPKRREITRRVKPKAGKGRRS